MSGILLTVTRPPRQRLDLSPLLPERLAGLTLEAIGAMTRLPNVIMPFPGGVVRSGSKIGSKYKGLPASTNDAFCPTLKAETASKLPPEAAAVLEIVIDGLTAEDIAASMRAGIAAACSAGEAGGLLQITAGNNGGKLGQFKFHLRELMA